MSTDAPERPCLFIGPDGQCRAPAAYVGSSREWGERFLCEAHKDADAVRTPIALFWAEVFAPAKVTVEITDVRIGKRPLQKTVGDYMLDCFACGESWPARDGYGCPRRAQHHPGMKTNIHTRLRTEPPLSELARGHFQQCPTCGVKLCDVGQSLLPGVEPLSEAEIIGALERSRFPQQVRDFHAHLDQCAQCREQPFNLCDAGARLLELGGRG